jgi:hypothetical protein
MLVYALEFALVYTLTIRIASYKMSVTSAVETALLSKKMNEDCFSFKHDLFQVR